MDTCDCLIVGGGPAGSSCARELVKSGFDVLVLDRAEFPRDKVCGGWITPAVVEELEIDLDDYRDQRTLQPIVGFRTGLIDGPQVYTPFGKTVSYGIRRCEFDHYLLARSAARLRLGQPLECLRRADNQWIINEEIRAKLVIGAGGHFCPVARLTAESSQAPDPVVLAQEIEYRMSPAESAACRIEPDIPELFFCEDLKGYAWCFRKGEFLNIGLGREGETRLSTHVAAFCKSIERMGRIPAGTRERFHGHAYRLYRGRPQRAAADSVLLIGDAAGLAYPQSGEGIRPAIESGLLAAQAIADAQGNYGRGLLAELQRRFAARFGRLQTKPDAPGLIPDSWRQVLARRLLATHWFTRHVIINRWFLHANQPPLATRRVHCAL
jgi:geranylgeranyl reductase family protein